jgi:hypothetical protein
MAQQIGMAQQMMRNDGRSDELVLDYGLEQTFPASDPVSIVQPQRPSRAERKHAVHEPSDASPPQPPGDASTPQDD